MGGRVGVESELATGSRFWLELKSAVEFLAESYSSQLSAPQHRFVLGRGFPAQEGAGSKVGLPRAI